MRSIKTVIREHGIKIFEAYDQPNRMAYMACYENGPDPSWGFGPSVSLAIASFFEMANDPERSKWRSSRKETP